ncbi:MAG: hypothetical protein AAFY02_10290 [Pseudomonadota bacterium]
MREQDEVYRWLDRHALVLAFWLPLGFLALALFLNGYRLTSDWLVGGAFAALLAAFVSHIIVNAVYQTFFSSRELALGLVLYLAGLLLFLFALLFGADKTQALFGSIGIGFLVLAVAVIFYLVTHLGVRRAFEAFDVISDFRRRRDERDQPS